MSKEDFEVGLFVSAVLNDMSRFVSGSIPGYSQRYGDCKTSSGLTPSYQEINNYNLIGCNNLCNIDDNCTGFSFDDTTKKCFVFTPSIGKTITAGVDTYNSPVYKAVIGSNVNNMCYIKNNNIPDGYSYISGGICTPIVGYTTRNYSSATFKDCYNSCKSDQQCQGFSYSNNGICAIHTPTFKQNGQLHSSVTNLGLEWRWEYVDNDPAIIANKPWEESISWWNLGNNNRPLFTVSPSADWKCYIKTNTEKQKTVIPNIANYDTLNGKCRAKDGKYPVYTQNYYGYIYRGVENVPGQTEELCKTTCNNDPLCSGYSWLTNVPFVGIYNRCELYNYTFSNKKGTLDVSTAIPWNYSEARYSPVYLSNNDPNWKCNIKTRDESSLYKPSTVGICKTNNNKDIPYTSGKTTYNNCFNLCEKDINCSGYSYSNDGTCILHNPTAPTNQYNSNQYNTTMEPSGTTLVQGDSNPNYKCYVKQYTKCYENLLLNENFRFPTLDISNSTNNIISYWSGGIIGNSDSTSNKTGVTILYNIQRAYLEPNTYIEQTINNKLFEKFVYFFNIYGYYDGKTDISLNLELNVNAINPTTNEKSVIYTNVTVTPINAQSNFTRTIIIDIIEIIPWIGQNINIVIKNRTTDRIYINKVDFLKENYCRINYNPSVNQTTTTTTTASSTSVSLSQTVASPDNTIPINYSTRPSTSSASNYTSNIINTIMVTPNIVNLVFTKIINPNQYDNIIISIKNVINATKQYYFSDSYNRTLNIYTINVSENRPTKTTENFIILDRGLLVKVIYPDEIRTSDPLSVNNLMSFSEDNIKEILLNNIPEADSSVNDNNTTNNTNTSNTTNTISSTSNTKTGMIVGIIIGFIVFIILIVAGIVLYKKYKKSKIQALVAG